MIETVYYSEMRTMMERLNANNLAVPFSVIVCTANRNKNTGGEFIKLDHAIKYANRQRKVRIVPLTHNKVNELSGNRDPNHWKNQTTNLAILAKDELSNKLVWTGEQMKVHFRSILFINGKRVLHESQKR